MGACLWTDRRRVVRRITVVEDSVVKIMTTIFRISRQDHVMGRATVAANATARRIL